MAGETIWKFPLRLVDRQVIRVPQGGFSMSVGLQRDQVCLWVMVDPEKPLVDREVRIVGTGHPAPGREWSFLGTVVMEPFVWHVFERRDDLVAEVVNA